MGTLIDVWSAGCVMAEMILGSPLFPGDSGMDQLVEIIKVLGTPSTAQIKAMNPGYTDFTFPSIKPVELAKVFRSRTDEQAIAFLSTVLVYEPQVRTTPQQACAHTFFDALRDPNFRLPNGNKVPYLDGI